MKPKNQCKTGFFLSFLVFSVLPCSAHQAQHPPERTDLVMSERLASWTPTAQDVFDGTVTFVSDDRVVLSVCHIQGDLQCPFLIKLQISNDALRPLARKEYSGGYVSLRVTEAAGVLALHSPWQGLPIEVFSPELNPIFQLPSSAKTSQSGTTIGTQHRDHPWSLSRVCPSLSCVEEMRHGTGELQAVSDDEIAISDRNSVRVETLQGKQLGGFKLHPRCGIEMEFADKERIYLRDCDRDRIVDLNGKELASLKHPGSWGEDARGWSADGTRLLYDQRIRTVPRPQKFGETVEALLTLGMAGPEDRANGEKILVLDTNTGQKCFDWKDTKNLANLGIYPHAAISPSGKFVALVTEGQLNIYRLPQVCLAK